MTKEIQEFLEILAKIPDTSEMEDERNKAISKIMEAVSVEELSEFSTENLREIYVYIQQVLPNSARVARTFMQIVSNIPASPSHIIDFI